MVKVNPPVKIFHSRNIDKTLFVTVVRAYHEFSVRYIPVLHEHVVGGVIVLLHIGTDKSVVVGVKERNIQIAGEFILPVFVRDIEVAVELHIRGGIRTVFERDVADVVVDGVVFTAQRRAVEREVRSRHYFLRSARVGLRKELHIARDAVDYRRAYYRELEPEIFFDERVYFVFERLEYALNELGKSTRHRVGGYSVKQHARDRVVKDEFVVLVDGDFEKGTDTRRPGVALQITGDKELFYRKAHKKSYELLVKDGVAEFIERTFVVLNIKVEYVTRVVSVGVYSIEVHTDEHLVGRAVVPLDKNVAVTDSVVVNILRAGFYIRSFLVGFVVILAVFRVFVLINEISVFVKVRIGV